MIDWLKVKNFDPSEFSENPSFAEPELIYSLNTLRTLTGKAIYPSPVKGALARFNGNVNTQHYAINRLSTACDIFCAGTPIINFITILGSKLFSGIGIYLSTTGIDGKPWVMFHLDIRKNTGKPIIWFVKKVVTDNGVSNLYCYPHRDLKYWSLFQNDRLYIDRA